jgi:hypothetical protein
MSYQSRPSTRSCLPACNISFIQYRNTLYCVCGNDYKLFCGDCNNRMWRNWSLNIVRNLCCRFWTSFDNIGLIISIFNLFCPKLMLNMAFTGSIPHRNQCSKVHLYWVKPGGSKSYQSRGKLVLSVSRIETRSTPQSDTVLTELTGSLQVTKSMGEITFNHLYCLCDNVFSHLELLIYLNRNKLRKQNKTRRILKRGSPKLPKKAGCAPRSSDGWVRVIESRGSQGHSNSCYPFEF